MNQDPYASTCQFLEETAVRCSERPAVVMDGVTVDYRELYCRAGQAAQQLSDALAQNRRVALLADNGLHYVILYWGTLLAGGVTVELNPGLGDGELLAQLRNSEPRMLLAETRYVERLERLGLRPAKGTVIAVQDFDQKINEAELAACLAESIEADIDCQVREELPLPTSNDLASIVHTSGTTGRVKGVCLSHKNLAWTTEAIAASFELRRNDFSERFLGNLPLFYTYGKSVLHLATYLGSPIVFTRRVLSPDTLLKLLEEQQITHLSLVPYFCSLLLMVTRFTDTALPSLRRITVAGGPLHDTLHDALVHRFPNRVIPMYGLTEASTRVTCMPAKELEKRPGSCGKPLIGVEIKIVDDHGRPVDSSATGEILVRGPNVMQGYFRDPLTSKEAMNGEWLRTGDLGYRDRNSYLYICGRCKDVIKVMGESISSHTIEAAIAALPEIAEVAVTGLPHPQMGEAICAFVVVRDDMDLSAKTVRQHCLKELGRARVPSHVEFVTALPKTASGKVRKHLLKLEPH